MDDMSFNLPLRRYGDADLVLLGDQALVAGDLYRSRASLKLGEPLQGALAGRTPTSYVEAVAMRPEGAATHMCSSRTPAAA